jgi:hypothetical protein
MRQSELLVTAQWQDIDWERRVLRLWDAKSGGREVPLTQNAIAILMTLPRGADEDRVFPVTVATVNSAWNKAIERAGIQDVHKHDLRHCALTRFARVLKGDIFLLKLVSGHKTLEQLVRYINASADDVVEALDAAQAGQQAPLHARGPLKHPAVEDAVKALDAAHVPDGSSVDAQQAAQRSDQGQGEPAMPAQFGGPAAAPEAGAGPLPEGARPFEGPAIQADVPADPTPLEDNGRVPGQGCVVTPGAPLGASGGATVISFAAWRARHAA